MPRSYPDSAKRENFCGGWDFQKAQLEAMMAEGHRALAARRPAAPAERLQTEPVLVAGEDLDALLRVALGFLRHRRGEFF